MTSPTSRAPVTQADREAAWSFRSPCYKEADREAWMSGRYDDAPGGPIQAFARHRLAHSPPEPTGGVKERARELLAEAMIASGAREKAIKAVLLPGEHDNLKEVMVGTALTALERALSSPPEPQPAGDRERIALAEQVGDALNDALAGWRYIRQHHGDLYGVGWDRVESRLVSALSILGSAFAGGGVSGETRRWLQDNIAAARKLMKTSAEAGHGYANFAAHDAYRAMTEIENALAHPASAAEGWVLVPREPTEEMIDAGTRAVAGEIADAAEGKGHLAGLPGAAAIDNANRQETAETWFAMIDAAQPAALDRRSG